MLRACTLLLLAGCDVVLGLDRPGHDDDGDGAPDDVDACPHLPDQSTLDADNDGISLDCDVDDAVVTANRRFWTFLDGQPPTELALVGGSATPDPGTEAIMFGIASGRGSIVIDVVTTTAVIDIGFEIIENAIDDASSTRPFVELGLHAVHREFDADNKRRGDTCYFGRDQPPAEGFLQVREDEETRGTPPQIAGRLTGTSGRMRLKRTPDRMDCQVVQASGLQSSNGFTVEDRGRTGKIAISSDHVRARLLYVWITYE